MDQGLTKGTSNIQISNHKLPLSHPPLFLLDLSAYFASVSKYTNRMMATSHKTSTSHKMKKI